MPLSMILGYSLKDSIADLLAVGRFRGNVRALFGVIPTEVAEYNREIGSESDFG